MTRSPGGVTSVAILIPVLDRPQRVKPLVESIAAAATFIELRPWFLCSPNDTDEHAAISACFGNIPWPTLHVVDWEPDVGDYARKINRGIEITEDEWLFMGSDDLHFHPGWIERALACHLETHACVIGTNDLGNRLTESGEHSTHTLVHRDYVACGIIDDTESGKLLYEGYDHQQCDTEFCETAKARETWAHATDSIVEHHHPFWAKAPHDATYRRGSAPGPLTGSCTTGAGASGSACTSPDQLVACYLPYEEATWQGSRSTCSAARTCSTNGCPAGPRRSTRASST